ncbi:MAG TPA: NirA family protein [Microvirga sp.]|nr:NirA family protein [Microvirga sp.]
MGAEFSPEQKRWLEGFASGAAAVRGVSGAVRPGAAAPAPEPTGPDAALVKAQDRAAGAGKKLVDQEKWKRAEHPMDAYQRLKDQALGGARPKPEDNFRWRYHGLFYVAPAQDSYMCRLRIPNGILSHWQFAAVADIAERLGGGYAHVTTRANLQIREIAPENGPAVVEGLADVGIIAKGAGADNIRNVTGSATAGIDPNELIDTRPHARAWHHHILNDRALYGLPRKFNVAFDGGGAVHTLEDTNDIGFQAVEVAAGAPVEPGVWYRLTLGGITGHQDFARDTGVIVRPGEAVRVADAIVRVFIEHGDRTNRNKARLKYVLDDWGFEKFLAAVEETLGAKLARIGGEHVKARPAYDRQAHVGVHPQKQPGLNWVGVVLPVGKMTSAQMRVIAAIAREAGDGDIRLTVWQNLLISGVPDAKVEDVKAHLTAVGLDWTTNSVRAGLVACTGNRGCKFANADTKGHALAIAEHVETRLDLDQSVNIHLTGCPNSCAQHYIGDIGLVGAKVAVGEDDQVEGYHLHVGGGFGSEAAIARLVYPDVRAEDAPRHVEGLLKAYLAHRADASESFHVFANRHDPDALRRMAEEALA